MTIEELIKALQDSATVLPDGLNANVYFENTNLIRNRGPYLVNDLSVGLNRIVLTRFLEGRDSD